MNKIETAKNKLNISAILFTYGVPINEAKQIGDFILKTASNEALKSFTSSIYLKIFFRRIYLKKLLEEYI